MQEVEKIKKQMSANSTRLPLNIECFMEERDVTSDMQRAEMEQICAETFSRVERTLRTVLPNASMYCIYPFHNLYNSFLNAKALKCTTKIK